MSNRRKSITVATLLVSVTIPLLSSIRADFPHADAQTVTNPKTETDKLFQLGVQQYRTGLYPQALQTYNQELEIKRQQNDKAGIGKTLKNIGEVYIGLQEYDKALQVLQQALAIRVELKDKAGEGETLDNLGWTYANKEQYDKALATLQQALAIRREVKDRTGEAKTLSKMGYVYNSAFKQYTKGLELLQQALAIQEQVGDKFQAASTLNRIAAYYSSLKDYPHALESAQKALSLHREVKNRAGEGGTLLGIGAIYSSQKKGDLALQALQQALPITRESGIRPREHQILLLISLIYYFGDVYSLEDKKERALEFGQQALVFAKENQLRPQQLESLIGLANIYSVQGSSYTVRGLDAQAKAEYARVIELSQEALILARVLKNRKSEAHALNYLGSSYIHLNQPQKAIEVLQQSLGIAREIKDVDIETSALSYLDTLYSDRGDFDKVIELRLREVEIARSQNDKLSEAINLVALGSTYDVRGEHQKVEQTYQQALAALRLLEINKLSPQQQEYAVTFEFETLKGLSFNYIQLGKYDLALNFAQQALQKAQSSRKPKLEAQGLLRLAFLYQNTFEDLSKAIEFSQKALTIARQIKEPALEAEALEKLSVVYKEQGKYTLALESAEQILTIAKRLENPKLEQNALDVLRDIYDKQGNYQKALSVAQQRLAVVQKANLGGDEIFALMTLSESYRSVGDIAKAESTAKQALTLAQKTPNSPTEALALFSLSLVYKDQGKYEQGIETTQKALEISRKIKNYGNEVIATVGLSEMYEALGEYQKVIAVAEPRLTLARKINKRDQEAQLLINLGTAYRLVGDYPKAQDLIQQGLKIARELKNPRLESIALNNLGYYYTSIKDYQKALAVAQQSLKIAQDLKSPPLLIAPFFNLGDIYASLRDYTKSRTNYQQALSTAQQLKNRQSEGNALLAQAHTYFAQGEPQKTVQLAQQALVIFQETKVPRLQAFAHRMLSVGYGELGNDARAMLEAQTFLTFAQKTQNVVWEKSALNLTGDLHKKFGGKQQAIASYQQALSVTTNTQVSGADAGIYAGLANVYQSLNQPNTAITYYKQYINKTEEVRRGIQGLPPELQKSFLETTVDFNKVKIADIYRQYANLLLSQGREIEATEVLELLKTQEIKEYSRSSTAATDKPKLPLTEAEAKIAAPNQSIVALAKQISECEKTNCKQKTQLNDQLSKVVKEFNLELEKIEKEINSRIANDKATFDPNKLATVREIVKQPGTVMIYPLVLDEKLWLLLYSGNAAKKFEVPVKRAELGKAVKEFRDLMEECEKRTCGSGDIAKIQPVSQKLYNWLIKPLETELKKNQVKNLVFALDRVTRYIPMSALFDGKQYLIENYTLYNVLSADLTDVRDKLPKGTQNNPVLAMGVSNAVGGFPALTNVPKELNAIVRSNTSNQGIYPGKEYLNNTFNYRTLRDNLTGYKVLHLATHGQFVPGSKDASYLLLGTGDKLAIPEIKTLTGLSNIHLVVLSACQTALAAPLQDGVEIASVAYYFLNSGAKAVMASLWQVSDTSTSELMQNFYQNLAQDAQPTKAESLRLAQLSLLYGKQVTLNNIKRGAINTEPISAKPDRQTTTSANFAHPYYWAPFILIGNGL